MSKQNLYIVGVGITHFAKHPDKTVKDLVREAVEGALQDAGCGRELIQAAYFATAGQGVIEGQHMVAGEVALKAMGITGIPVTPVRGGYFDSPGTPPPRMVWKSRTREETSRMPTAMAPAILWAEVVLPAADGPVSMTMRWPAASTSSAMLSIWS